MFRIVYLCALATFLFAPQASPASPAWQWAQQSGTDGLAVTTAVDMDDLGNACVVGVFIGEVNFGQEYSPGSRNGAGGPVIAESGAHVSGFVASYYGNGLVRWLKVIRAADNFVYPSGVADGGNRCYVTGRFVGDVDFAPDEPGVDGFVSLDWTGPYQKTFVAAYNKTGTLEWLRSAVGFMRDLDAQDLVTGPGGIYMTGTMHSPILFQSVAGPIVDHDWDDTEVLFESVEGCEAYVAKYNWDGTIAWSNMLTRSDACNTGNALAANRSRVYVTGRFAGDDVQFRGTGDPLLATSDSNSYDVFVARLSSSGLLQSLHTRPNEGDDEPGGVATDRYGRTYVTGTYRNGNNKQFFLSRLSSSCTTCTMWETVGPQGTTGTDVAVIPSGSSIFLLGGYGSAGFEGVGLWPVMESKGGQDVFVARLSTNGTPQWIARAGGPASDYGYGIDAATGYWFGEMAMIGARISVPGTLVLGDALVLDDENGFGFLARLGDSFTTDSL